MAGPLRFRHSTQTWTIERVRSALLRPLDERFGATLSTPWYVPPDGYQARRIEMDNGDLALFAWGNGQAYWLGNTETPEALWRTDKIEIGAAPDGLGTWAERELAAGVALAEPWLAEYESLLEFFLPVLCSKDGAESTRRFFREEAAGFPDASREEGLTFYDDFLKTGALDEFRYEMAAKLGTSEAPDGVRMRATMAEFNAAKLLIDAGYEVVPEPAVADGHYLDFRVPTADVLVEVTRPEPPTRRRAGTPAAAIRETVDGKTGTQLRAAPNALLLVDCTSFRDDEWQAILDGKPAVGHEPVVIYRYRPDGQLEGYALGNVPLELGFVTAPA
ncbi:MAG: DUF5784 family protein [Salinirussus sp.]